MNIAFSNNDQPTAVATFVSVVIPHYNDLLALTECVRLLELQTYPRDRFEIIVADNNSACGLAAVKSVAPGGDRGPGADPGRGTGA